MVGLAMRWLGESSQIARNRLPRSGRGESKINAFNVEFPNMNSFRRELHAAHIYGNSGGAFNEMHMAVGEYMRSIQTLNGFKDGVVNEREEWHNKEIVRDSKVGRWADDWRAGLPDEYEVGGSVAPSPTVVEAKQSGGVVAGQEGYKRRL
ncbi:hypothetical protein ACSQ67_025411 [Phaseolus vulgaris]